MSLVNNRIRTPDSGFYPEAPGVYIMKNAQETILYIGKAKNLKARIKTYFSQGDQRPALPYLMSQVNAIETIITLTEQDALILEHQLIQRHRPKYNVLLKDDKSFIRILLTSHRWPMLRLIRTKDPSSVKGRLFGPYPNTTQARHALEQLKTWLPLRQCSDTEFAARTRPCILHEMKRCVAPCMNLCSYAEYQRYVTQAVQFLTGHNSELLDSLQQEMDRASQALEFERAGELLRVIQEMQHAQTSPVTHPDTQECDLLGLYRERDTLILAHLVFRHGTLIASECFSFHLILSDDKEALETFLMQYYTHATLLPRRILTPIPCHPSLATLLSETYQKPVSIETPHRGKRKNLLAMATANAKAFFQKEQEMRHVTEDLLLQLQDTLELTHFPRRIDCVDTSHTSGGDAVASVVSFLNGKPDPSRTRLFRITPSTEKAMSDLWAMRQALLRHMRRHREDLCDLLIVDGGIGQLHLAMEVLQELEIAYIDLIALTKEEGRHDKGLSQEKVYVPHRKDPILLPTRSHLLFFLQTIRDEAHRRALSFHTQRRKKRLFASELDTCTGIGPVKKRALLRAFGSVQAIKKASLEELQRIPCLRKKDLDQLLRWKDETPPSQ